MKKKKVKSVVKDLIVCYVFISLLGTILMNFQWNNSLIEDDVDIVSLSSEEYEIAQAPKPPPPDGQAPGMIKLDPLSIIQFVLSILYIVLLIFTIYQLATKKQVKEEDHR